MSDTPPLLELSGLESAAPENVIEPSMLGIHARAWQQALVADGGIARADIDGEAGYIIGGRAANEAAWRAPDIWSYGATDAAAVFRTQLGADHVTILDGEAHRRLRKLILPGFGIAALQAQAQTMAALLSAGVSAWTGCFELHGALCHLLATTFMRTQLRAPLDAEQTRGLCHFEEDFIAGIQLSAEQQAAWFARPGYQQVRGNAFDGFRGVLEQRRSGATASDSLQIILDRQSPTGMSDLTDSELIEVIYLLAVAGVGNIAFLLCCLLWEWQRGDWAAALAEEVADLDPSDLQALRSAPLLGAVIAETERLYSPAPVISKRTALDARLLGKHLTADTLVLHLHTLAHFECDAPYTFWPERWLQARPPKPNVFGGGKHLCLGMGVTRAYLPMLFVLLTRVLGERHFMTNAPTLEPLDVSFGLVPRTLRVSVDW